MSGSGRMPDGSSYITPADTPDPEATRQAMEAVPDSGPELIQPGDESEPPESAK